MEGARWKESLVEIYAVGGENVIARYGSLR